MKGEEIIINARKEAALVHPETGEYLELDVYLPSLKLAFEFQVNFFFSAKEKQPAQTCVVLGEASLCDIRLYLRAVGADKGKRCPKERVGTHQRYNVGDCSLLVGRSA